MQLVRLITIIPPLVRLVITAAAPTNASTKTRGRAGIRQTFFAIVKELCCRCFYLDTFLAEDIYTVLTFYSRLWREKRSMQCRALLLLSLSRQHRLSRLVKVSAKWKIATFNRTRRRQKSFFCVSGFWDSVCPNAHNKGIYFQSPPLA